MPLLLYLCLCVGLWYILYCILCALKKFGNFSYFFTAVCGGDPFCFLVLGVSVCFAFVMEGAFQLG
jgi:hypothetical protein